MSWLDRRRPKKARPFRHEHQLISVKRRLWEFSLLSPPSLLSSPLDDGQFHIPLPATREESSK